MMLVPKRRTTRVGVFGGGALRQKKLLMRPRAPRLIEGKEPYKDVEVRAARHV